MKRYLIALVLIAGLMCVSSVLYAADNQVGTWKLNLAKSKNDPANLAPDRRVGAGAASRPPIADA